MKYGIVLYKDTANIGDDVQIYATSQFLPQIDVILDREHIDETVCDEPVAAVMNGWWLHQKWNWPPANNIRPLFVAFHYAPYKRTKYYGEEIKTTFLEGMGLDYLKRYGPIGCRDLNTKELLDSLGVETWFSGCMTLTLPQMPKKQPEKKYICLVDVETSKAAGALADRAAKEGMEVRTLTHAITPYSEDVSWEERAGKVEELLTVYQNATCVITSRLHCALPCLALGTPVLLVRHDLDNIRFQPFTQWLHTATTKDVEEGRFAYSLSNPPANNGGHIPTREKLIETVKDFVAHADEQQEKFSPTELERLRWHNAQLKKGMEASLSGYCNHVIEAERAIRRGQQREQKLEHKLLRARLRRDKGDMSAVEADGSGETSLMQKVRGSLKAYGLGGTFRKIINKLRKRD
ncbi:MAG: polysaccharide pyruvyl transferase family protein [Clostridia bacterium]|nr:polysaccharide pyruvyl transferase family protein [Clostridia bacterium]